MQTFVCHFNVICWICIPVVDLKTVDDFGLDAYVEWHSQACTR